MTPVKEDTLRNGRYVYRYGGSTSTPGPIGVLIESLPLEMEIYEVGADEDPEVLQSVRRGLDDFKHGRFVSLGKPVEWAELEIDD
jgi:hypothetical protein